MCRFSDKLNVLSKGRTLEGWEKYTRRSLVRYFVPIWHSEYSRDRLGVHKARVAELRKTCKIFMLRPDGSIMLQRPRRR
jgi:hypothetical protein